MKKIFYLFMLILTSCKSSPDRFKRDTFLGFQLGATKEELKAKQQELLQLNKISVYNNLIFYKSIFRTGQPYYTMPRFYFEKGDTLLSSIRVFYTEYLSPLSIPYNNSLNDFSYTLDAEGDGISSIDLSNSIFDELTKKYGKFSRIDSNSTPNLMSKHIWSNKNDVDISLSLYMKNGYPFRSAIVLEYTYNEKIRKKIFKSSSLY